MSTARAALKWKVGVAATVCLIAWLGLLPAQQGAAQNRSPSVSPDGLWHAYPLAPTAQPSTQPEQASSPTARTERRPVGAAAPASEGGAPVFILVLLALVAAGMLTFAGVRRRRKIEPAAASVALQTSRSTPGAHLDPPLWHGPSGRFTRSATRSPAGAMVAATGRAGPDAGDDPPSRNGLAGPADAEPPPVTPIVAPAPAGAPPDPTLSWAAEIEWRQIRGEAHFCVVAQGSGTVEVAQSAPLAWPPDGPSEVQAVADAADELAATVVAAGWKELPPGTAWYAKRFAWEPVEAEPAEEAKPPGRVERPQASPKRSTEAKRVAPARPAARVAPADDSDEVRTKRSRAKAVAVLSLLAVVGLIATLQYAGGDDEGQKSAPQEGIDLTVPLLALVGVVFLVLLIREMRRKYPADEATATRSRR